MDATTEPLASLSKWNALSQLLERQLAAGPGQERFFAKRFADVPDEKLAMLEETSEAILQILDGDVDGHCEDYLWWCQRQMEEELFFRRNGKYRLSTFEEADRLVYSDHEFMTRYMNGLLMTEVWWSNHSDAIEFYRKRFLAELDKGKSLLEIGPGHGLLVHYASREASPSSIEAWDVSKASVDATRKCVDRLGIGGEVELVHQDLFAADTSRSFDAIVISEVLEHLEDPASALRTLRSITAEGGRIYIQMPANSPSPDHLYLIRSADEFRELVTGAGFEILEEAYLPATNVSLERAVRKNLTINCVAVVGADQS